MNELFEMFEKWEKRKNSGDFPEMVFYSDKSGHIMDCYDDTIFSFENPDELIEFLKTD